MNAGWLRERRRAYRGGKCLIRWLEKNLNAIWSDLSDKIHNSIIAIENTLKLSDVQGWIRNMLVWENGSFLFITKSFTITIAITITAFCAQQYVRKLYLLRLSANFRTFSGWLISDPFRSRLMYPVGFRGFFWGSGLDAFGQIFIT